MRLKNSLTGRCCYCRLYYSGVLAVEIVLLIRGLSETAVCETQLTVQQAIRVGIDGVNVRIPFVGQRPTVYGREAPIRERKHVVSDTSDGGSSSRMPAHPALFLREMCALYDAGDLETGDFLLMR